MILKNCRKMEKSFCKNILTKQANMLYNATVVVGIAYHNNCTHCYDCICYAEQTKIIDLPLREVVSL